MSSTLFSHVTISVSDLDRSSRFYCEGLGFEEVDRHPVPDQLAALLELGDELHAEVAVVRRDETRIELVRFDPPPQAAAGRRSPTAAGVRHLAFRVGDADEVSVRLEELGGTIYSDTRTARTDEAGAVRDVLIVCADPDGQRILLIQR